MLNTTFSRNKPSFEQMLECVSKVHEKGLLCEDLAKNYEDLYELERKDNIVLKKIIAIHEERENLVNTIRKLF